jgi:hypothetical protein
LGLDCYLPGNMIIIDASGWSDLLLGVVICAIKPPQSIVFERRISTEAFQPPNFKNKKYLLDSERIADELVNVMQTDSETCFKVCSEYMLSSVIKRLKNKGFKVEEVQTTGDFRKTADDAYVRWCVEKGVPRELLDSKMRFWSFVEWVAENPHVREGLVKTGWTSWQMRWRTEVYKEHINRG